MKKLLIILIFMFLSSVVFAAESKSIKNSIVKIYTISNEANYYQPWQMNGQRQSGGSGVVISGNRILTNAHVVSNRTFIQVRRYGQTEKTVATVVAIDHDCDLAILEVKDKTFFSGSVPVKLGKLPKQGDTVKVLGFPSGGDKLSITEGVVSRVEIGTYAHSFSRFLNIQIDAAINPGNSGGPVIMDDKIVGIAFQSYLDAENMGYAIPTKIIKHFLKDMKDGKYDGFPYIDVMIQKLENKAHREYLGMKDNQTGFLVSEVAYGSAAWGVLEENDVILAMDGVDIANDGTIPFGNRGRVDAIYKINSKYVGDKMVLKIFRDKKIKKVTITLKKRNDVVSRLQYDVKPTYYIFGGYVFTPLSGNYIQEWGSNNPPISLTYKYYNETMKEDKKGVVVMIQVLADKTNVGYHDFRSIIVEKVNGQKVQDLKHMISVIEANKDKYLVIEVEGKQQIVLNYEESKKASKGILDRYMIPKDRSDDMKTTEIPKVGLNDLK